MNASHHPGSRRQAPTRRDGALVIPSASGKGRLFFEFTSRETFPERQSEARNVGSIPGDDEDPLTPMAGANLTGGDAHGHARIPE